MTEPLLLSVVETARLMGLNRAVVAGLCKRGELPFVPLRDADGRPSRVHKRIPRKAVLEWIDRNTVRTKEDLRRAVDGRRRPA